MRMTQLPAGTQERAAQIIPDVPGNGGNWTMNPLLVQTVEHSQTLETGRSRRPAYGVRRLINAITRRTANGVAIIEAQNNRGESSRSSFWLLGFMPTQ